jgi:ABC-type antimicrobial peptide transport system permease subunit
MALGASRAGVLRLVLKQGLTFTAIGLVLGLAAALVLARSLSALLYGARLTDPLSFLAAAALPQWRYGMSSPITGLDGSQPRRERSGQGSRAQAPA